MSNRGFTFAELLIVLLILGEIATFTIPKLITSLQNGMKKAVMKEVIGSLNDILYTGVLKGEISDSANPDSYMLGRINIVKLFSTNIVAGGCAPQPIPHPDMAAYKGGILHNGAMIAVSNNGYMVNYEEVLIDWNGASGPNLIDQDQFVVLIVFGTASPAQAR